MLQLPELHARYIIANVYLFMNVMTLTYSELKQAQFNFTSNTWHDKVHSAMLIIKCLQDKGDKFFTEWTTATITELIILPSCMHTE